MKQLNAHIIISGGGTGGHIFPALAIAEALKDIIPGVEILFIGAEGRMEMEKVPAAGYPIESLWISGLRRDLSIDNLMFPFKLISSLWKSRSILKKSRPDAVVGVGGYASGPALWMASQMGIPTLIQEQNSFPGITNKLLAKRVDRICVAYENMDRFFPKEKIILSGNPVRANVIKTEGKKAEAAILFGLDPEKQTLLVLGGSQGALSINKSISKILAYFKKKDLQLLWQTGPSYFKTASDAVRMINYPGIKPVDFIKRMDLAFALCDIVVSRAGATTISELSAVAKASIFIPLPSAAEDHQMKNAMRLKEKNAALLVKDSEATAKLEQTIDSLVMNKELQKKLAQNIRQFAVPDADKIIAGEILKLINR